MSKHVVAAAAAAENDDTARETPLSAASASQRALLCEDSAGPIISHETREAATSATASAVADANRKSDNDGDEGEESASDEPAVLVVDNSCGGGGDGDCAFGRLLPAGFSQPGDDASSLPAASAAAIAAAASEAAIIARSRGAQLSSSSELGSNSSSPAEMRRRDNNRRVWTAEEDDAIRSLVKSHGTRSWAKIEEGLSSKFFISGRSGKQCRERWHNHLDPNIKKGAWTPEEEVVMTKARAEIGNRWSEIAKRLPGRTDNQVKNFWYSCMRRNVRRLSREVSDIPELGTYTFSNEPFQEGSSHGTDLNTSSLRKTRKGSAADDDEDDGVKSSNKGKKKKQKIDVTGVKKGRDTAKGATRVVGKKRSKDNKDDEDEDEGEEEDDEEDDEDEDEDEDDDDDDDDDDEEEEEEDSVDDRHHNTRHRLRHHRASSQRSNKRQDAVTRTLANNDESQKGKKNSSGRDDRGVGCVVPLVAPKVAQAAATLMARDKAMSQAAAVAKKRKLKATIPRQATGLNELERYMKAAKAAALEVLSAASRKDPGACLTPREEQRLVDAANGVGQPSNKADLDESLVSAAITIVSTTASDASNDVTMAAIKMASGRTGFREKFRLRLEETGGLHCKKNRPNRSVSERVATLPKDKKAAALRHRKNPVISAALAAEAVVSAAAREAPTSSPASPVPASDAPAPSPTPPAEEASVEDGERILAETAPNAAAGSSVGGNCCRCCGATVARQSRDVVAVTLPMSSLSDPLPLLDMAEVGNKCSSSSSCERKSRTGLHEEDDPGDHAAGGTGGSQTIVSLSMDGKDNGEEVLPSSPPTAFSGSLPQEPFPKQRCFTSVTTAATPRAAASIAAAAAAAAAAEAAAAAPSMLGLGFRGDDGHGQNKSAAPPTLHSTNDATSLPGQFPLSCSGYGRGNGMPSKDILPHSGCGGGGVGRSALLKPASPDPAKKTVGDAFGDVTVAHCQHDKGHRSIPHLQPWEQPHGLEGATGPGIVASNTTTPSHPHIPAAKSAPYRSGISDSTSDVAVEMLPFPSPTSSPADTGTSEVAAAAVTAATTPAPFHEGSRHVGVSYHKDLAAMTSGASSPTKERLRGTSLKYVPTSTATATTCDVARSSLEDSSSGGCGAGGLSWKGSPTPPGYQVASSAAVSDDLDSADGEGVYALYRPPSGGSSGNAAGAKHPVEPSPPPQEHNARMPIPTPHQQHIHYPYNQYQDNLPKSHHQPLESYRQHPQHHLHLYQRQHHNYSQHCQGFDSHPYHHHQVGASCGGEGSSSHHAFAPCSVFGGGGRGGGTVSSAGSEMGHIAGI